MWYTQFMNIQIYESITVYTPSSSASPRMDKLLEEAEKANEVLRFVGSVDVKSGKVGWFQCAWRWDHGSQMTWKHQFVIFQASVKLGRYPKVSWWHQCLVGVWKLFEKAIGELEVFGSKMIENMKPESLDWDLHGILSSNFRPEDHPFAGTQFADNICAVSSKYATSEPSRKVMAYKAESASVMLAASKAFGVGSGFESFQINSWRRHKNWAVANMQSRCMFASLLPKNRWKGVEWNVPVELGDEVETVLYFISWIYLDMLRRFQQSTWVEITKIS